MASYTFYNTIPAASNAPKNDQPLMLINNQSTQSILGTDHITFNLPNGGKHNQTTLVDQSSNPSTIASEMKIWNNGNDLFFRGQNNGPVQQLSSGGLNYPIRAWGFWTSSGGLVASGNVTSVTFVSGLYYLVTMTTAAPSANYAVVAMSCDGAPYQTQISESANPPTRTTNTFYLQQYQNNTAVNGFAFSFIVVGG